MILKSEKGDSITIFAGMTRVVDLQTVGDGRGVALQKRAVFCNKVLYFWQIEESIRDIVTRYGRRLWKLRVLQAEMKVTIRYWKLLQCHLIISPSSRRHLCSQHFTSISPLATALVAITVIPSRLLSFIRAL